MSHWPDTPGASIDNSRRVALCLINEFGSLTGTASNDHDLGIATCLTCRGRRQLGYCPPGWTQRVPNNLLLALTWHWVHLSAPAPHYLLELLLCYAWPVHLCKLFETKYQTVSVRCPASRPCHSWNSAWNVSACYCAYNLRLLALA